MKRLDETHISSLEHELNDLEDKNQEYQPAWCLLFQFLALGVKIQLKTYQLLKDINHKTG